jgi:DNA polymerase III alpha subunit
MEAAVAERARGGEFKSLEDFCARVDAKKINKKSLESLVKCGAFDFIGVERAQLCAEIDAAMASAASDHRDLNQGQAGFDLLLGEVKKQKKTATISRRGAAVEPHGELAF